MNLITGESDEPALRGSQKNMLPPQTYVKALVGSRDYLYNLKAGPPGRCTVMKTLSSLLLKPGVKKAIEISHSSCAPVGDVLGALLDRTPTSAIIMQPVPSENNHSPTGLAVDI